LRFDIVTPPTTDPASLAVSPDGLKIVFVAESEGRARLWLRSLDSVVARPLPPTDGAALPFWSPDSRSIGFFAGTKLKRIDIESAATQILSDVPRGFGGTWNGAGDILYAPASGVPILRASSSGGESMEVTRLEPQHASHRFPQFLPDGRHFLFYVEGAPAVRGVWVGQLGDLNARRVVDTDAAAVFAASGHLIYVRQGTLFAQAFDPSALQLTGSPLPVAEQASATRGIAALSASAAGPIGYRMGATVGRRQLTWVDRSGREIGVVGDPIASATFSPAISADGRRVALEQSTGATTNVWLLDLTRSVVSRFTFGTSIDNYPVWSPDGTRIIFSSVRGGVLDLYEKSATGAGEERRLLATKVAKIPSDWSPDGRMLLYRMGDPKGGNDIWALPMNGEGKPFLVVDTAYDAREAQFSPDGRWIAYQSDESGRFEIYIQPFAGRDGTVSGKWQISSAGGAQVRWRRDGRELYYIALDGRMIAVPVRLSPKGDAVDAGTPAALFPTRVGGAVQSFARQQYMVSPDGQRFLMGNVVEESGAPITVILNWRPPESGR
jgi:Tol biopolymer transport system component